MLNINTTSNAKGVALFLHKLGRYIFTVLLLCRFDSAIAAVPDALERPAIISHLGAHSVLLSAALVGEHVIAVGERGLILCSDDKGKSWQQLPSPVSVTLTGVSFSDDKNGYAIGHEGTVLRTTDGGNNWQVQLNGRQLAKSLLRKAEQSGDNEAIRQAKLLVSDGPDKPFLDMLLLGPDHLVVVGAYGFAFESKNGGKTWDSWMGRIQNFSGLHLYSISKQGDRILIAGEQGFVALSKNDGQTFKTLDAPYEGSFFTSQLMGGNKIVLAGLRGNAFISNDNGQDWERIKNPVSSSIVTSLIQPNGRVIMADQAGILLGLKNNILVPLTRKRLPSLTSITETSQNSVLALSFEGPIIMGELK